ncbi:MAG: hypothetical protein ACE5M4_05745 [Anaerolineales bacterium]
MSADPGVDPRGTISEVLEVAPHQEALMNELFDRRTDLGNIYLGALFVLSNASNHDRHALAAHNLRELMDRLMAHIGVDTRAWTDQMAGRLEPLVTAWTQASENSSAHTGPDDWSGAIDNHLRKFLHKAEKFFAWLNENRIARRVSVRQTLENLDPGRKQVPEAIRAPGIKAWMKYHKYFVGVAHHHGFAPSEFDSNLHDLEHYLLNRLRPRTFQEFEEIRKLIEQGEASD